MDVGTLAGVGDGLTDVDRIEIDIAEFALRSLSWVVGVILGGFGVREDFG